MTATLNTLFGFSDTDGGFPTGSLIADANGDLFGTTRDGGTYGNYGTVFELVNDGGGYTLNTLVNFNNGSDGQKPEGSLIADANGDLFGTTSSGAQETGGGTVFELVNSGGSYTLNTLINLNPYAPTPTGATPVGSLIADASGDLFGTTEGGGYFHNGTVFELVNNGGGYTLNTLVNFNGTDGGYPQGGLIADANGDLFGTTSSGSQGGTVFELVNTGGSYTLNTLVTFNNFGSHGNLIADAKGDLFGTTAGGGAYTEGTVFELVNGGGGDYTLKTLVTFNGTDGGIPGGGLIADANGDLFGTTSVGGTDGHGTVFELVNDGGGYTLNTLVNFNVTNGGNPQGNLIADASGDLFGTTFEGGPNGFGTVFEITDSGFVVSPPPIVMPDFAHATFGTTINVASAGVLANDTPATAGDTLTVSAVDGLSQDVGTAVAGAYGSLTLDAKGGYAYAASGQSALPSSGVSEDFFHYTALEGGPHGGGSASSTLAVVVTAPGLTYVAAPAGGSATQPNGGHYAVLDGTAGNAILNAANGIGAALVGGNGDTLNGANSGKDTFVFMGDFGKDTVNNYIGKANGNFDVIQLSKSDFGTNPAALMYDATQAPGSANTVITDPVNHDTIIIEPVAKLFGTPFHNPSQNRGNIFRIHPTIFKEIF